LPFLSKSYETFPSSSLSITSGTRKQLFSVSCAECRSGNRILAEEREKVPYGLHSQARAPRIGKAEEKEQELAKRSGEPHARSEVEPR